MFLLISPFGLWGGLAGVPWEASHERNPFVGALNGLILPKGGPLEASHKRNRFMEARIGILLPKGGPLQTSYGRNPFSLLMFDFGFCLRNCLCEIAPLLIQPPAGWARGCMSNGAQIRTTQAITSLHSLPLPTTTHQYPLLATTSHHHHQPPLHTTSLH